MDPGPDAPEIRREQNQIDKAKLIIKFLNFILLDLFVFLFFKSYDDEFWIIWMTLYTVAIVVTIILLKDLDNVKNLPIRKILITVLTIMAWGFYGMHYESKRIHDVNRKIVDSVFILFWIAQLFTLKNGHELLRGDAADHNAEALTNCLAKLKRMVRFWNFFGIIFFASCVRYYYQDEFYYIWVPLYTFIGLVTAAVVYNPLVCQRLPLENIFIAVLITMFCGFYAMYFRSQRNPLLYERYPELLDASFTLLWMGQWIALKDVNNWAWAGMSMLFISNVYIYAIDR